MEGWEGNFKMKAIAYVRVSTEEQHLGPEAQRAAIEKWCEFNKAELVEIHEDRLSGGSKVEDRPGLLAALDAIKVHGADVLIVAKRDRLARDVVLSAMIERLVNRDGAKVVSSDGVGNGNGPEAQLMKHIIDAFAQYERAIIRARTSAAMQTMRRKKQYTGGNVRYGFRKGVDGRLIAIPTEQKVIKLALKYREVGTGLRRIANTLNAAGYRSRTGAEFQAVQVKNMLRVG
jgi:DNA invertase Pin-like site-specific DNA recombinase